MQIPLTPDPGRGPDRLGLDPGETQPLLQQDVFKELVNKFSWAIGTTYRQRYSNTRSLSRLAALKLARTFVLAEGYPQHIGYPK